LKVAVNICYEFHNRSRHGVIFFCKIFQEKKMTSLKKSRTLIILFSAIIIITALGNCSTGNFGRLQSDREITQAFKTLTILADHKYYYRGTFSSPTVIVGINENFSLNLTLWVTIDPQSKDFKTLVDRVSLQSMLGGSTVQPWGYKILDQTGNTVGIWYSALRSAAVQVNENNEIVNLAPTGNITRMNQR
jgi:hypothetical protein